MKPVKRLFLFNIFVVLIVFTVFLYACASQDAYSSGKEAMKPAISAPEAPAKSMTEDAEGMEKAEKTAIAKEEVQVKAKASVMPSESEADTASELGVPAQVSEKKDDISAQTRSKKSESESTVKYLSADDSNSAASPIIARKMILGGKYVQPAVIRTYEFLNYYSFSYQEPAAEQLIHIIPQMRALEKDGEYSLQVAVRSLDRTMEELPRFNITFLLDVSGSMAGEPIELAKKIILRFTEKMRTGDLLSVVICSREARILLDSYNVNLNSRKYLEKLFDGIDVNDITDLEKGIIKAYEVAGRNYNYKFLNRVIVISDGAANAGKTAVETIARHAEDSDRQGIYLAGIGLGEGFNDKLMDTLTDKGHGAYLFVDSPQEIDHLLEASRFIANFDIAVKNVRLKMVMPPGWRMEEFHGEQVSDKASDITPQYLSPNDQMIYHLTVSTDRSREEAGDQVFTFEAEYSPIPGSPNLVKAEARVSDMKTGQKEILKGDAVVEYAELLKKIRYPLDQNREENINDFKDSVQKIIDANEILEDPELTGILDLLSVYKKTIQQGEQFAGAGDRIDQSPGAVLGISANTLRKVSYTALNRDKAIKSLKRLGSSTRLVPQEGYRFLVLSSGPVWNPHPSGGGELSGRTYPDPCPSYMGWTKVISGKQKVYDLQQIHLELTAPRKAKSFSFDFNFFSAEYPQYVNQNFNDSFYAIIKAPSTNKGKATNIAFDSNNNSIEVDSNYFENPFHPIPNTGTGFDCHGSTGWLRTSWPIMGGESFTLTFSIHDEGDGIYDSLVVIDNFQWHEYGAVGTTDPLN